MENEAFRPKARGNTLGCMLIIVQPWFWFPLGTLICMACTYLLTEHRNDSFSQHLGDRVGMWQRKVKDVPLHLYEGTILAQLLPPRCALFLYNGTVEEHIDFLHDVRASLIASPSVSPASQHR